jgi:integrase
MRLNDRTVTGANPTLPRGKNDYIFFDEDISGLGLRVREKGSRTFVFQYWHGGRARRITLGKYPKLSANAARELVAGVGGLAARVAVGQDPAGDKAASRERNADSVATITALYLAAQAKRLKPRSFAGVELHLNVHAKPLHNMPVDKVSRRDVADLLTTLAQVSGPVSANRVRSSISAMFNWAMKAGRAETNPAAFTNKENEKPRERVLADHELAKVWNALPEGDFGTIVKLLALTGLRRDEIGALRWSEIDMKRGTITLPPERVKNNRQHIIPMSEPVRSLIKAMRKTPGRDFVFGYGDGGFSGWSRCKERLNAAVALPDWTLHDVRRSVATGMGDLGVQPHIIEAALNHVSGHKAGVAGVYQKSLHETEVREALALWAKHVMKIVVTRRKRERAA